MVTGARDAGGSGRIGRRAVSAGLVALSLLPPIVLLWPSAPYAVDLLANWYALMLAIAVAALAGSLGLRRWRVAAASGVCLTLTLAAGIAARWPDDFAPPPADATVRLTIITLNAGGPAPAASERIVDWLLAQDADVISIREPGAVLMSHPRLREAFAFYSTPQQHPIYSRYELAMPDRPSDVGEAAHERGVYWGGGRLVIDGRRRLTLMAVHAPSPRRPTTWRENGTHLRWYGEYAAYARAADDVPPMMVAGDFNAAFTGRHLREFEARAALREANPNRWAAGTWPAWLPTWLSIPLDHVYLPPQVYRVACRIGPNIGSDHRPIVVVVALRPDDAPPVAPADRNGDSP